MTFFACIWQYWIAEPFTWLFLSIFQPVRFQKDVVLKTIPERLLLALRLLLPMFLLTYPGVLFIRIGLYRLSPALYQYYFTHGPSHRELDTVAFWFDATWATAVSCVSGGLFGSIFGLEYGIAFGLAGGIMDGLSINLTSDTLIMINFGLATGLMLGLTFNRLGRMRYQSPGATTIGMGLGIVLGMVIGIITGIFCGFGAGVLMRIVGARMLIPDIQNGTGVEGNVAGIIAGLIVACLVTKIIGTITEGNSRSNQDLIHIATTVAIAVAGTTAVSVGMITGDDAMRNVGLQTVIVSRSLYGIEVSIVFLAGYIPGYYKLPLYPVSALSLLRTYSRSRKNPSYVFHHLRHSALHWDECIFPPLPRLKHTLLIAAEQNINETLTEIDFILHERPQQRRAAEDVAVKIALDDLHMRESLRDISTAQQRLAITLSEEIRSANPRLARAFHRLENASQDAANYSTHIHWQARYDALEDMLSNLQKAFPTVVFQDTTLNQRLQEVLQKWLAAARHEMGRVSRKSRSEQVGRIENPYVPGLILEQHDPLFVGRGELAQQLGEALRREHRPTFFLLGERRMGKSSVLKQLPQLLGSRYLPIFYDLQSTGIASSVAALLAAIAEEVYDTLLIRGMLVRKLEYEQLKNDLRENEAVVYHRFGRWLKEVERVLAQEDRVLLLAFDEFEKLAEAEQRGYLDLSLLFGWFRSLIQNHPHLVLLFSGVKSISEMGGQWAGYFVNVEILPVSFLQPEEARRLITHPTPDFPGEQIFGEEVAEEIMRVTGCHPFLLQALCSVLIAHLNDCSRQHANIEDVEYAIEEIFKKWEDNYFRDLWERTDQEQRICLKTIHTLGTGHLKQLQQQCALDEMTLTTTLQKLLKRDLLHHDDDSYQIVAPIFSHWVAQNT